MKYLRGLLLLYSIFLSTVFSQEYAEHSVYCVTAFSNQSNSTCHTLKYYMSNSSLFFRSNTTFVFYAGEHLTDFNVTLQVSNVSGLTLKGRDATIQCNKQMNCFHFDHVQNLTISGLNFSQCGISHYHKTTSLATLLVTNVINFVFRNSVISRSEYQGLVFHDSFGNISILESIIDHCQASDQQPPNTLNFTNCSYNSTTYVTVNSTQFVGNINRNESKFSKVHFRPVAAGLTFIINCPNVSVHLDNFTADGNIGEHGGNLAFNLCTAELYRAQTITVTNSIFRNGAADQGGGILVLLIQPFFSNKPQTENHTILLIENTTFDNNSASFFGGAIIIQEEESNITFPIGDIIIRNCTFNNNSLNKVGYGGTAISSTNFIIAEVDQHVNPQYKVFITNCTFRGNYLNKNIHVAAGTAVIFAKNNPFFKLSNISITNSNSSGILGLQSNLVFGGTVVISHNTAQSGGGILLCQNSIMYLETGLNLSIFNNMARIGGGIAVESTCIVSKPLCFFQFVSSSHRDINEVTVSLHNNTAEHAGDNLYGGSVDFCYLIKYSIHESAFHTNDKVFQTIFDIKPPFGAGKPSVTSIPSHVCVCEDNVTICNKTQISNLLPVFPGQQLKISIILAGQLDGSVPGLVTAKQDHYQYNYKPYRLDRRCTEISYIVHSNQTGINVTLEIDAVQQGDVSEIEYLPHYRLFVVVPIFDCPKGFVVNSSIGICVCQPLLEDASVSCNISNLTLTVPSDVWIGYIKTKDIYVSTRDCPPEYCNTGPSVLNASPPHFDQDSQCQPHRTGVMCGQCVDGYSVTFGGSSCIKCSNNWLWLLLVYAFAGVFLVFVLTFLDITVADGTINGLIFYANVVQANLSTLFTEETKNDPLTSIFRVFLGWLSLENAPETCLYDGLTEYSKAWLSFALPFYIWIILGLIVLFSRRSSLVMRLIGNNAVKVFATLLLLSYSKFIPLILSSFYYTEITASNGTQWLVWTRDGNIPFLGSQHLPLFIFSIVLTVLFIPFTISLLLIQVLERFSHYRLFCLVNKFKPLLDAYTGPYSDNARFWTGFLLVARIIITIFSSISRKLHYVDNISITTAVLVFILTSVAFLGNGIYKRKGLHILEVSLYFNLTLMLIATSYAGYSNAFESHILSQILVGFAFFLFIGVLVYHLAKKIYSIPFVRGCVLDLKGRVMRKFQSRKIVHEEIENLPPVVQSVEYREPLLAEN